MTAKYGWIALGIFSMSSVAFAQTQQQLPDPNLTPKQIRACEQLEKAPATKYLGGINGNTPDAVADADYAKFLAHIPRNCAAEIKYQMAHLFDFLHPFDVASTTGQGQATAPVTSGTRAASTAKNGPAAPAGVSQANPASQGAPPASFADDPRNGGNISPAEPHDY